MLVRSRLEQVDEQEIRDTGVEEVLGLAQGRDG